MFIFPKEFFDLNFRFVSKAGEILQRPVDQLLLDYTHTFRRFRLGSELNATHPIWLEFLDEFRQAKDPVDYIYQFYLARNALMGPKKIEHLFGCFSYDLHPLNGVQLHFQNNDASGYGPLSTPRKAERLRELVDLFSEIRKENIGNQRVFCGTWLSNLPAFQRLFPPEFCASAKVATREFPYISLWGQFFDHHFCLKPEMISEFLVRLEKATEPADLETCFPYPVLHSQANLNVFLDFYLIQ